MAFQYQAQPLPILEPGQMNPFNQAFRSGLNTFQEGMQAAYLPSQLKEKLLAQKIENQIQGIKAKYAPMTMQADAASKLAYANLMGPQFLAKLMGNNDIVANIPDEQKKQALQMLYRAGSGQNNVSPGIKNFSNPAEMIDAARDSSLINNVPMDQIDISNKRATGYQVPPNQYDIKNNTPFNSNQSFAENIGSYEGIKSEGKKSGEIRAQEITDLNNAVFNGQTRQETFDQLSEILSSPEFEKIRQVPLAGRHELAYYAKFGTPEQKNMAGQYYTLTGNIIKDSASDFKGQFRVGEQKLLNSMKANPSDTVDVARGKVEALSYMNKMLTERSRMTSEIMNKYHVNKLEAQKIADKNINGDAIRQEIHNKINPKPTDSDIEYMAMKYKISPEEVRKKLKLKGLL